MARRLTWNAAALDDVDAAAAYIARDSPRYAAAFVRRIRDAARSLRTLSERGRMVPELGEPAVRELLVGSYRLIYEMHQREVIVLALVHGARNLASLWPSDPR
jgi:toxin ParE1/3/4